MKDQVDALQAAASPRPFSTPRSTTTRPAPRLRGLHRGRIEAALRGAGAPAARRLAREPAGVERQRARRSTRPTASREWGHDFRPEYRQLARCATLLPGVPVMALTATATDRVRADIVTHLRLHEPAMLRRQLQPAQSHLPGAAQGPAARPDPGLRAPGVPARAASSIARAAPTTERVASRSPSAASPRGHTTPGLTPTERCRKPGAVSPRRSPDHLRHHRLWHGHQQAQRPLGHPPRPAQEPRGLLPGDRPRRARRPARRLPAALQRRRRGQADPFHRRNDRRAGAQRRPRPAPPDDPLRRERRLPPARAAGLLRRILPPGQLRGLRQLPGAP